MYLAASRDYSRKDKYNPLLLIVEAWTGLGPVVFLFALGGFPRKNSDVWFIFVAWIYLFIAASCYYLFNFAQINGRKFLMFTGTLTLPN